MFLQQLTFCVSLLICVGGLLGLYSFLQAEMPEGPPPPHAREVAAPPRRTFFESIESDFYQTIIRNNLFAPLGTVLNPEPVPGANLKLLGTFVSKDAVHSTAIIKNETTGRQEMLSIGGGLGNFQVVEIQCQQVTLDHLGSSVVLRLPSGVLLNAKRR
ncbi:hypothetical protein F4Z98_17425 [Candidatus Poribacteria bacterium]|nr:hypothetical protein [Candidatus Poribacteria bacterium]